MFKQKLALAIAFGTFLFVIEAPAGGSCEPVEIAPLYQCAHDLRGLVYALNDRQIFIKGFNYDGKGPAAWFHGQLKGSKGVYTSEPNTFVTLPYPDASCDRLTKGKEYKDKNITLTLPRSIKDFVTIGVYCYEYCHNFGHIVIPENLNVPPAPTDLLQTNACAKPNYKGCGISDTKNGAIRPDCKAGAASGAANLTIIVGLLLLSITFVFRK